VQQEEEEERHQQLQGVRWAAGTRPDQTAQEEAARSLQLRPEPEPEGVTSSVQPVLPLDWWRLRVSTSCNGLVEGKCESGSA